MTGPFAIGDDENPTELLPRLAGPVALHARGPTQAEIPRTAFSRTTQPNHCRGAQRTPRQARRDGARTMVIPVVPARGGRVTKGKAKRPVIKRSLGHAPFILLGLALLFAARPAGHSPAPAPMVTVAAPTHFAEVDRVLMMRGLDLPAGERQAVARAIAEECDRAGYDPFLILGLIDVESDFRRDATSPVGAYGLMQIRPDTLAWVARKSGVTLPATLIAKDPALCVRLGIRYLKQLHDQFHSLDLALMAYNAGPNKVAALSVERHGLDPYWGYVNSVHREGETLRAQETAEAIAQR
jgi:hypothetical protein